MKIRTLNCGIEVIYDSEQVPILVELTEEEKDLISRMEDADRILIYPDDKMTAKEAKAFFLKE